jgi:hypothetical protein
MRQEDWTVQVMFEDFAADKKLSRAKRAWLNDEYDRIQLSADEPAIAEQFWCDQLGLPDAVYVVELIAHILDLVKPRKGDELPRLFEISGELVHRGHLSYVGYSTHP